MLTVEEIKELEAFDAGDARVLSVYLDLDPTRQVQRSYRVVLKDLVKETRAGLDKPVRRQLSGEAARVEEWLMTEGPHGRGLALFSCTSRGLWQTYFFPVRVDDHLVFEPQPDVAPMLELVDEYERYAVALVDKEKARLLTVFMGEIEEVDAFKDFAPGKHDQGGPSQARYQRHHETHVRWHLKRVAHHLDELLRRRSFDRLIVAGPEEATSELRDLLPHALAERLVAVILAELSAGQAEILEKTLEVERRVERDAEEGLVEELLGTAAAGGRATFGIAPTLEALWLGEVQTLVAAHGVVVPGSECGSCGRFEQGGLSACPACGSPLNEVHDLVDRAMARVLEQGGSVEVVHDDAAQRLLETGGGLGAMLRYS